jgi:ligand-binding SRPBCC domain-containing protein
MPVFERSVEVAAPIAEVFAFHLDTRNVPRITPPQQEVLEIVGEFPLVVGAVVDMRIRQAPVPTAQPWRIRVTAIEPPTLVRDEVIDNEMFSRFVHTHRFEELEPGLTRLMDHIDWDMHSRMLAGMAKGIIEKTFTGRQDRTRDLLGGGAGGA